MVEKDDTPRGISGKKKQERLENAYQEWRLGKSKSDKELAEKYNIHPQDLSRYITSKIEINKK